MGELEFRRDVLNKERTNLENGFDQYPKDIVKQSIVHTREELISIYYKMDQIRGYLKFIILLLIIIAGILIYKL